MRISRLLVLISGMLIQLSAHASQSEQNFWKVKELLGYKAMTINLVEGSNTLNPRVLGKATREELLQLQAVTDAIATASNTAVDLYLVLGGVHPNAFASRVKGRGFFAVNIAMFDLIKGDPDAAAALVGHEIGHLNSMHLEKTIEAQKNAKIGATVLASIGFGLLVAYGIANQDNGEAVGEISKGAAEIVYFSYSRDQEREADTVGLSYLVSAGFNPHGSVRLWRNFVADYGPGSFSLSNTHPTSGERMQTMQNVITTTYPRFIEFPSLRTKLNLTSNDADTLETEHTAYSSKSPSFEDKEERVPSQYRKVSCNINGGIYVKSLLQCIRDGGKPIK